MNFGQRMKAEADQAMADMNDILDKPVRDEDWGVIHAIANHAKKPKEEVAKVIRELPVGRTFCEDLVPRVVFVKTPDNKLEQAQNYITRLEKVLLRYAQNETQYKSEIALWKERYEDMTVAPFLGNIVWFFRTLSEKFRGFLRAIGVLE